MKHVMVVRVTATEFETSDGAIHPHMFPFEPGEVPSLEEFQRIYDHWRKVLLLDPQEDVVEDD